MKRQPHRLPAESRHGLGGSEIDRSKPLNFRLNGQTYEAFAGDTVLSALLAAGVQSAGQRFSDTIALEAESAPRVVAARRVSDPSAALPMDRVPVLAGLDLLTVGPRAGPLPQSGIGARLGGLFVRRNRSLGHRLDDPRSLGTPPASAGEARRIDADTLVIGGGIAGMTAALAAAEAGGQVVLLERRPILGGDARFFGTVGEEEAPELTIERLTRQIAATPAISVLTRTEALTLAGTRVRALEIAASEGGDIEGRPLSIEAQRVILATGTTERLPIFPGNRLPGVVGAVEAFHLADRYGVWHGHRAVFATPNNYGYRLALLVADAGIEVQRVADSRIGPQSRFIDFCKASGITLASGMVPRSADATRRSRELTVAFAVAVEETGQDAGSVTTDTFVVAGGWQPRLNLWLMAGGPCVYDHAHRWLAATGELEGVTIVGSAAGWRSSTACLASATAAIETRRGRKQKPVAVTEYEVDAVYESAEAPAPVAPWRPGRGAYLDRGKSFTTRPAPARGDGPSMPPGEIGVLSLCDVASFVQLGAIPDRDAGIVAQERCIAAGEIVDTGWRVPSPPPSAPDAVPAYLVGRYGPRPQLAVVTADDGRRLETGCLVYPGSDTSRPEAAIGSIVGPAPAGKSGALMIASRSGLAQSVPLFVRDTSGAVPVTLVEKL